VTGEEPASTPGWCTNWQAFNTPRLWAMVADEDDPESWKQVAAMGAMADTVEDQRSRLIIARDALVEAWPPDKNAAAQAFLAQVNTLLFRMKDTKAKAEQSAAALGHVLEALRQAKTNIQPLYQEYLDKSDDLVPGWWDHAEDELDEQARQHMIVAEKAVAPHAEEIKAPAPYALTMDGYKDAGERGFPAGGGSTRGASGSQSTGATSDGYVMNVPHNPPPPLPGHDPIDRAVAGSDTPDGPGLAGVTPIQPGAAPVGPPPIPALVGVPTSVSMIIGPGAGPVGGLLRPIGGGPVRGLPPGSVIGGSPLRGGRPAGVKPTPPSWLPGVGQTGTLGSTGQPSRGGSGRSGGRGVPGAGSPGIQGRRQLDDGDKSMEFDPDNPWATAQGVCPIIEPSRRHPRHDPGPGVIGSYE
jgi:hypothetical protein